MTAETPTPVTTETPTRPEAAAARTSAEPPTPEDPWGILLAKPGHAPELLALAAVHALGPRARTWVAQTRRAYPAATPHAVARLATHQFTRFGSLAGVVGAVAGSLGPAALTATAALTHAELVLHIAAAYGHDPTDRQRAVDLLVITGVHPAPADAEAALAAACGPPDADRKSGGVSAGVWRLGRLLAGQAGAWSVVRAVNRYFPGTSLLAAALAGHASARTVAARAHAHYKPGPPGGHAPYNQLSHDSGSRV